MTLRREMITFVLAATALASMPGCDAELAADDQGLDGLVGGDLSFRDDCNPLLADCSYRNNFYLGLEEYGIDNLPLVQGSDPNVDITEIFSSRCYGPTGNVIQGSFHVVDPDLTVDASGNFGAVVFEDATDQGSTCIVSDVLWESTEWYVTANAESSSGLLDTIDAKLRIAHMYVTAGQSTLYIWETDLDYLYLGIATGWWSPTCDEDPSPVLDFHAVVYPHLRISETTGEFLTDLDTAYLGCTAGLTAKSGYEWGYYAQPPSVHQVITHAGMATYCGPTAGSYTQTGIKLEVWNKTGAGPDQTPIDYVNDPFWTPEAAWDASMTAMCIGKTRVSNFQPGAGGFSCVGANGSFSIPTCTPQILDDPSVMFITYALK